MNIYKYEAFLKIVEMGSLKKAAEAMGYTQPGLSHILNSLEADLNAKLLIRDRSGISLSSVGQELLPYIGTICEDEQRLREKMREISELNAGIIKLGVFPSMATHVIPEVLALFLEKNPNFNVQLYPGKYGEIEDWVRQGKVNMGFVIEPSGKSLKLRPLKEDKIMVVMPRGHPLETFDAVPQEILLKYPFILYGSGCLEDYKHVEVFEQLRANAKYTGSDDNTIFSMVESRLGISLAPELVLKRIAYDIVWRELDPPAYRTIVVIVRADTKIPASIKRFCDQISYILDSK